MDINVTPRVVFDYKVTLDGVTFDALDLLETLIEMDCTDIEITNQPMVKMLKNKGVIESEGNRRWCFGAIKGQNYEEFVEELRNAIGEKKTALTKYKAVLK